MSLNYFILHGHFYQPPRENPWTGFVDRQASAYPYNDWNLRINTECYAACTRTPILVQNEVVKIINCFEYLSFNIGPTLLSWMEKKDADPRALRHIIEGDKISSAKNNGHGNAIAQVYSHMIMPLASEKDQYTQIIWGLKDFKKHFGRDSEGIWLSETAINNRTAEILVDCGIKFVILSPFQARSVTVGGATVDVLGGRVDPSTPYKLLTKNGVLNVFFYDPKLAFDISFGDLLGDANRLIGAVREKFAYQQKDVKLVHTATDGEVYGHHKNHGNMALAKTIYDITKKNSPEFQFTNYGRFLAEHPPIEECELFLGDNGEGSSWSCAHGVGRWIRDCGCHTGGGEEWDQKWRTPLRESMDLLRDELYKKIEEHTKDLVKDIWEARNDYFSLMVLKTKESYKEFFTLHQKKELSLNEQHMIIQMMEALRYEMLMYTSCGWFFSDISGIETVQDLLYAVRAYEFAKNILDPNVILQCQEILTTAISNKKEEKNGRSILDEGILKYKINRETLLEYMCWFVVFATNEKLEYFTQDTDEFSIERIWYDLENRCYLIAFKDHTGLNKTIAYRINICEQRHLCDLIWREVDSYQESEFLKDEFWKETHHQWTSSLLSSLPIFLRLRLIARNTKVKMERSAKKYFEDDALFLNVVWGTESMLLPYEKRVLVFQYATQLHEFACAMMDKDDLGNIEVFAKKVELLKKSTSFQEEVALYLDPIAVALEKYLTRALKSQNETMVKQARIVFWEIKEYIHPINMDILRDYIYRFYMKKAPFPQHSQFTEEFYTLMNSMEFTVPK